MRCSSITSICLKNSADMQARAVFLMPAEHFDALREGLLNDMAALLAENPQLF